MADKSDEHAGSGLDKPDPKTLVQKVKDGVRSILPDKASTPGKPSPTQPPEVAPIIVSSAD